MTCPHGCGPLETFVEASSARTLHWCGPCATVWVGEDASSLSWVISATSASTRARQKDSASIASASATMRARSERVAAPAA